MYRAIVQAENENQTYHYIGLTGTSFKARLANHNTTFKNESKENSTALSQYIWELKRKKKKYHIKWEIVARAKKYSPGASKCNLCIEEKLQIILASKNKDFLLLNRRSEIASSCRHRTKFKLG